GPVQLLRLRRTQRFAALQAVRLGSGPSDNAPLRGSAGGILDKVDFAVRREVQSPPGIMIFLSDFLNAEVVDLKQHRIGRVRDLIVLMSDPFPRVTGVVLKGNRRLRAIDWTVVRSWDNKELSLKLDEVALQPHTRADSELWLSRQVLD